MRNDASDRVDTSSWKNLNAVDYLKVASDCLRHLYRIARRYVASLRHLPQHTHRPILISLQLRAKNAGATEVSTDSSRLYQRRPDAEAGYFLR